ncbi:hypothetical protein EOB59_03295 [Mesorhizobium sp. M7A.F.Ca.MR.176.00.0.0]|uniref:hypothetical protein n=1 Tax=Mesorhizobium sp. M7A.F.Ca.MR.176.00.0.0 TaxID=2496776 RepID=UPI000FD50260|nr:hypothetical protein [Mesorhizobium sp. M7A.F.Ca.MR.176.00.0.0]RUU93342.1 hypothetical protein EOB59_03295 [Mesorhizobium sp. M7A.F.Ca.MR.176.00.0.0]
MEPNKTTLERAFELARSGDCADFAQIKAKLRAERYDLAQLEGGMLRKQLNEICQQARASDDK